MDIRESWIIQQAVNANAVKNGKAIYQQHKFTHLYESEDHSFYMGECQGSGSSLYTTSVDFIEEQQPVFRCNCPSRQFPCKHSIGLLYAMMAKESFESCDIPEDIIKKRQRLGKREEIEIEETKPKKTASKTTANVKRFQKQLEGITIARQFLQDILQMGIAAFLHSNLSGYRSVVDQMNDYYLPGLQKELTILLYEAKQCLQEENYTTIITHLERLHAIVKRGELLLQKKIAKEPLEEADLLVEECLGHIWKLQELDALGYGKDDRTLLQLGFRVRYSEPLSEYIEEGFWIVLEDGEVHKTSNIRPKKALKYIKEEDSVLDCIVTPRLFQYPGLVNKRIRYETCHTRKITLEDLQKVKQACITSLSDMVKLVKNEWKHPLSNREVAVLVSYDAIEKTQDAYYIGIGNEKCKLSAFPGYHLDMLQQLPQQTLLTKQSALLLVSYDDQEQEMITRIVCLISDEHIVRMLY